MDVKRKSAMAFIAGVERCQRIRVQRAMWLLCDENRKIGGEYWKKVLKSFGLTEDQVWGVKK